MKKYFVEFFSPGTFVSEKTTKEIDCHDTKLAMIMTKEIEERHGAVPYGFQFITRERSDDELDSKITYRSSMYFLGGKVETLEEVQARNDPKERILLGNMECNGIKRIIINTNSYKITLPLEDGDVVLDW